MKWTEAEAWTWYIYESQTSGSSQPRKGMASSSASVSGTDAGPRDSPETPAEPLKGRIVGPQLSPAWFLVQSSHVKEASANSETVHLSYSPPQYKSCEHHHGPKQQEPGGRVGRRLIQLHNSFQRDWEAFYTHINCGVGNILFIYSLVLFSSHQQQQRVPLHE